MTSGPFVYTAIAVINVLVNSSLLYGETPLISSLQPSLPAPALQFQVQTGKPHHFCTISVLRKNHGLLMIQDLLKGRHLNLGLIHFEPKIRAYVQK